jgi:demethylmenaquinone methyltransferase/2-methoxy-6-polyprenyl-1,4-benzoquinol methylase
VIHEQIKPYGTEGEKSEQVEQMFDNIAPAYDTLNHRLSWNIDRYWRGKAVEALKAYAPKTILDIATGTGDFAIEQARRLPSVTRVVGADISEGMMRIGREKVMREQLQQVIMFQREDCTQLSFADDTFDAVTAAFGIRNFQDLEQGLREMYRVLRPGGVFCVLELTTPVAFPMKQLFRLYSHTILPVYGRLVSKDTAAYSYLTATIDAFPQGEEMMQILRRIGFATATFRRLTFGICTMYIAQK